MADQIRRGWGHGEVKGRWQITLGFCFTHTGKGMQGFTAGGGD